MCLRYNPNEEDNWKKDIEELEYLLEIPLSSGLKDEIVENMGNFESKYGCDSHKTLEMLNIKKIELINCKHKDHIGEYNSLSLENKSRYLKMRKDLVEKKNKQPTVVLWLDDHFSLANYWGRHLFANLRDMDMDYAPFYVFIPQYGFIMDLLS